jgi:hypothetical protein
VHALYLTAFGDENLAMQAAMEAMKATEATE